jgi:hypothetical protein
MPTSLQRASRPQTGPGDLTGARAIQLDRQKADHEAARERLIRDLHEGHDFAYLPDIPGYGTGVVPRVVLDYLRAEFSR